MIEVNIPLKKFMKTSTVQALLHYIYQSKKKRLSCIIMSGSSRSRLDIYDVCSAHKTGKRLLHAHCETFLCILINLDQTGSYWIKMNHVGSLCNIFVCFDKSGSNRIILDLVKSYGIKMDRNVSNHNFGK